MDLSRAIDLNRTALARILAGLFALLGLTDGAAPERISRALHRAIAGTLRPAESAARRLIMSLAKTVRVKASPPRSMPKGIVRAGGGKPRLSFQLFDPRKRFFRKRIPPDIARARPSITFFDRSGYRRIYLCPEPRPSLDGLAASATLARRLQALKAALDDLPRHAKRLARALARRASVPRLKFQGVMRPGLAPGWRKRPLEEIDEVLRQCDWLAREALAPDTS